MESEQAARLKRVQLIIFDLDGTLVDSRLDIVNSVNAMRTELELETLPPGTIAGFVGHGVRHLISNSLGPENGDLLENGLDLFFKHYDRHCLDSTLPYPDVVETLNRFQQKELVVLSNKPEAFCKKILDGLILLPHFSHVFGGDSFEEKKPSAAPIRKILALVGAPAAASVIVGDGDTDINSGRAAGILTIGVTYGFRGRPPVAHADIVIDSISALTEHLS